MLILICGRARAGKTTYSLRFKNVLHCDNVRARYGEKYQKVYEIVSAQDNIVVDGLFETVEKRVGLLQAYKGGKSKRCIWIDTDIKTIALRSTRGRSDNPIHARPHKFEPPTLAEGWDEIILIRPNEVRKIKRRY